MSGVKTVETRAQDTTHQFTLQTYLWQFISCVYCNNYFDKKKARKDVLLFWITSSEDVVCAVICLQYFDKFVVCS